MSFELASRLPPAVRGRPSRPARAGAAGPPSALLACLLALAGCGPAAPSADDARATTTPGGRVETGAAVEPDTATALKALPYLQAYRDAEDRPLISHYDRAAAFPGLNLYLSGHAAEADLVDMEGRSVHRWRYPLRRLWPEVAKQPGIAKLDYWRHAHVFDDGRLLAIFEGLGMVALDAQSNVLWAYRGGTHHDLFVDGDGNVHVLERISHVVPRMHPTRPVLEDFVTTLDSRGRVLRRRSVLEAVERSPFSALLERVSRRSGDIFHTNAVVPLDGRFAARNPAFRRGNLLISMRELDAVAVLDPERNTIVWALTGGWRRQHAPSLVGDGNLLLFDNQGAGREVSRVLEVDPASGATRWQFGGESPAVLSSKTLGSAQRLANGNTLIVDSQRGRALEVTPRHDVVWDFYNPHRMGEQGKLVAALMELTRLPPDLPFLGRQGGRPAAAPGR